MVKNEKLKVLHFSQLINRHDFMDVIIRHADKARFEMLACTMIGKSNIQNPEYEVSGIPHFILDLPFKKRGFVLAIAKLSQLIRRQQIDLIHAHHYYECLIAAMATILARRGILIVGRHYHNELYLSTSGLKLKLYLVLEKFVNYRSRFIISPSTQISNLLLMQGVKKEKIVLIPYGFEFKASKYMLCPAEEVSSLRASLGVMPNNILIGNFARHHPIKGQNLMLQAFSKIAKNNTKTKLLMVGDGPYSLFLKNLAKDLCLTDRVIFVGWQKNINKFLSAVDLVWHPTNQEAFPQIMIEAMALEKPLFITPVSGAADVIIDGKNGFFLPFGEVDIWAKILLSSLSDKERLTSTGKAGKETVVSSFSIETTIKRFEDAYDRAG